jgi:hypothetical protein
MKDQDFLYENVNAGIRRALKALDANSNFQVWMTNEKFAEAFVSNVSAKICADEEVSVSEHK